MLGIGVAGRLLRDGVAGRENGQPIDRAARFTCLWGFRSLGGVAGKEPVGEDKEHDRIQQQRG